MKTNELTGAALDWAVTKCEGGTDIWQAANGEWCVEFNGKKDFFDQYKYSTDWAQGGPIIERNLITIFRRDEEWFAYSSLSFTVDFHGATPLIAAMRCYVASKLGDDVDVPKELT